MFLSHDFFSHSSFLSPTFRYLYLFFLRITFGNFVRLEKIVCGNVCVLFGIKSEGRISHVKGDLNENTYRSKLIRKRNVISNGYSIVYCIPYESRPPRFTRTEGPSNDNDDAVVVESAIAWGISNQSLSMPCVARIFFTKLVWQRRATMNVTRTQCSLDCVCVFVSYKEKLHVLDVAQHVVDPNTLCDLAITTFSLPLYPQLFTIPLYVTQWFMAHVWQKSFVLVVWMRMLYTHIYENWWLKWHLLSSSIESIGCIRSHRLLYSI